MYTAATVGSKPRFARDLLRAKPPRYPTAINSRAASVEIDCNSSRLLDRHRQPYGDSRALAQPAFDFEAALVKLQNVLNDREA